MSRGVLGAIAEQDSRPLGWFAGRGTPFVLGGILLLSAGLRIHDLDRLEIWVDEGNSILTARRPLSIIATILKLDSSPPAYYFTLHYWMAVFGDSAFALRMLAVVGSVLLTGVVFAIGRRWIGSEAGLWAAFFVAASSTQIFFSQQVRMYTWLSLLALVSVWWLVRYLESGRLLHLAGCLAVTAAALFTHNFALYLLVVLAAVVLVSGQLVTRWWAWGISAVAIGAVYAPWLPTLVRQSENANHYAWFLPLWEKFGPLGAIVNTFRSYSPAGELVMFEYRGATNWYGIPAAGMAALAALGLVTLIRRRAELGRVGCAWVPLFLFVPMVFAVSVSSLLTPHYVPGRVDQMMFPAFALLAAVGMSAMRPMLLKLGLGAAVLLVCVLSKGDFYTDYREYRFRGGDRALATVIRRELEPGDVIVCTSLIRASVEYYLRDAEVKILSYPRETAGHLGAQNDHRWLSDDPGLEAEFKRVVEQARAAAGPGGRLFLLRVNRIVNEKISSQALYRQFSIRQLESLGQFAQVGTRETVDVTVHRLKLPVSSSPIIE
jgi:4-amino-4-deoxy-L-arabinose transferase-like glycosyltransferase